ncbi:hypothetical protein GH714_039092 [Hevea brasiliensis]|uniref:MSP domain-containing protein n=1 Tax=Hevea brasiliensis TaxID=3981 RepID=A0A6A6MSH4_HEVBR|nr:hypothetical protein GH714_039092 [Hevea brasiliensis]
MSAGYLLSVELRSSNFHVKTTNPKKYCVRPNTGVVSPRSTCDVIVTMQAQKEAPPDMQCKDKFLLQSVVASPGATAKDVNAEMARTLISKLTEEKNSAIQQNKKLRQELRNMSNVMTGPCSQVSPNLGVRLFDFIAGAKFKAPKFSCAASVLMFLAELRIASAF